MFIRKKIVCIYTITNQIDGKIYVGYTSNYVQRKSRHSKDLEYNIHKNSHLQNAYNSHGKDNFKIEILEECKKELLLALEHYWATILNVHNKNYGYNYQPTHPYTKVMYSKADRIKTRIKIAEKKIPRSEEAKKKFEETRQRIIKERGFWVSKEGRENISKSRKSLSCKNKDEFIQIKNT